MMFSNNFFLIFLFIVFSLFCSAQGHKELYVDLLEPGSKLVSSGYNYTLEKLGKQKFVYKMYFTGNRQITHFITYTSKSKKVKNGQYYECYDDGTILRKGQYANNIKEGEWIEEESLIGRYVNGKKDGIWIMRDDDNRTLSEMSYKKGLLDGYWISYDSLGQVKSKTEFKDDLPVIQKDETGLSLEEKMPQFPGCEYVQDENERQQCKTRHLLIYLSKNIVYPEASLRLNIQGTALIQYIIEKDGKISDVNVRRGVDPYIKAECYRVMSLMPDWEPGMQNGRAVRVKFTLPIVFRLD